MSKFSEHHADIMIKERKLMEYDADRFKMTPCPYGLIDECVHTDNMCITCTLNIKGLEEKVNYG